VRRRVFIDRDRVEPAHRTGVHHGDQIHFRPENLPIAKGVAWRDGSGKKHPLTQQAIDKMLEPLPKDSSGTILAVCCIRAFAAVTEPEKLLIVY
jgi:hypothetical protein